MSASGYWKLKRTEEGWREDKAEWQRLAEADLATLSGQVGGGKLSASSRTAPRIVASAASSPRRRGVDALVDPARELGHVLAGRGRGW